MTQATAIADADVVRAWAEGMKTFNVPDCCVLYAVPQATHCILSFAAAQCFTHSCKDGKPDPNAINLGPFNSMVMNDCNALYSFK